MNETRYATAWRWTVNTLAVVGFAAVLSVSWFALKVTQYERENHRRYAGPPVTVSPTAASIAARFAPELVDLANTHKDGVVAASGNAIERFAVRTIYPAGVKAIPYCTEIGTDRALSYLSTLTIADLAESLVSHAKATGGPIDHTIYAAAERRR